MNVERVYGWVVRLYPARMRRNHGGAMRQALHDALAAREESRASLFWLMANDTVRSLAREHAATMLNFTFRPALVFNALVLSGVATILALALYAIPQQVLRQGANDPQVQMAGDAAARLEAGAAPGAAAPAAQIDLGRSLAPFVIVYDAAGRAVASQATLAGAVPTPPAGVFDYARQHGEDRITWQPGPSVRIAAVVDAIASGNGGYVLAGRSLREVESRESQVGEMAGLAWLGMLGLILCGTLAAAWFGRGGAAIITQ